MDTLQNMRAFSCVAEAGSFTAAAVQLDTTTANVSRAVSNLEAHLQTRLLNRTTRQLNLTFAGEPGKSAGNLASSILHELDKQRLRILRCTAHAMASGPGGLRFKAGTQPWLEGLPVGPKAGGGRNDARAEA